MNVIKLAEMVEDGAKFSINFRKRTCRINGKDYVVCEKVGDGREQILSMIEFLYNKYKHSVPSERSESHRRTYFKALSEKDLSDENMMYGRKRELARFELEAYILNAINTGELTWDESWGSWFWQSPNDKDLVILREWIEPKKDGE